MTLTSVESSAARMAPSWQPSSGESARQVKAAPGRNRSCGGASCGFKWPEGTVRRIEKKEIMPHLLIAAPSTHYAKRTGRRRKGYHCAASTTFRRRERRHQLSGTREKGSNAWFVRVGQINRNWNQRCCVIPQLGSPDSPKRFALITLPPSYTSYQHRLRSTQLKMFENG